MAESTHNQPDFTVSDLANALKRTVEDAFGLVRVRGEISQPKVVGSGHCYLRLKDDKSVLEGIIWRGSLARMTIRPEEGLEVIATGKLTTYGARSQYQMIIDHLEVAGEGALLKLLEDRKRKLAAEGLFAAERKQPLPPLPTTIGVVTSPTGAVIRDILHRLRDRFPRHVLLWPVKVQGEGAAEAIAEAIAGFDALPIDGDTPRPDVLIVARGGGSLEDLWAFNEEIVVRAVANCSIPVISAVGHETDTTLIDYVSDLRAPTPTGAAEKAVPVRLDLMARVAELGARLPRALLSSTEAHARHLDALSRALPQPDRLLAEATQRLDDRGERLDQGLSIYLNRADDKLINLGHRLRTPQDVVNRAHERLDTLAHSLTRAMQRHISTAEQKLAPLPPRLAPAIQRKLDATEQTLSSRRALLDSLSYKRVLERGFALVRHADGQAISTAAAISSGDNLTLTFADGHVDAIAGSTGQTPPPSTPPSAANVAKPAKPQGRRKSAKSDPRQGSLL